MFSRIADEVIIPFPAPLTAGASRDKLAWVGAQLDTTKKRGQGWVSIVVGPNPALVDQVRAAHALIEPDSDFESTQANPLGLRYQVACAVLAGARGFVFRTFQPLEISGAGQGATLAALRWIHDDLTLWGPWIVGGQITAPPALSRNDFIATAWSVSQSRLVVAATIADSAQYSLPATAAGPLQLSISAPNTPQQVFRLSGGRLERIDAEQTAAGLTWSVTTPEPIESFIITANPLVIDFARSHLRRQVDRRAADQLDVISYNMGLAAKTVQARYGAFAGDPARSPAAEDMRRLGLAQRQLEQGYQALRARQATAAIALAAQASDAIQGVLSEGFQVATSNLAAPQSSPLVVSPVALAYHWQLADACARSSWSELVIPGAGFLRPQEMEGQGWSLEQRPLEQADLQVEFIPPAGERPAGLRLAAYPSVGLAVGGRDAANHDSESRATMSRGMGSVAIQGGYEGASSRVRSSAASVHVGQLVRVSAKARILNSPATSDSGVLIYDNQAGPSLGQLVRGAPGEVVAVELYRFVVAEGEFRLLAECRGQCDIVLEQVTASVITPAVNRRSYTTNRQMQDASP